MIKKSNRATISDIADQAGVSISTVSNVINGKTTAMKEDTLARIQKIMEHLNYHPSSVARGLALQRTATIGLILAEIETPLFLQAVIPMERVARDEGYGILLMNAHDEEDEKEAVRLLSEKQVDGIVIISTSDKRPNDYLLKVQEGGIPIVLINRTESFDELDDIRWDNAGGVYGIVQYLANIGHSRIAIFTGPENRRSTQERLEGYINGITQIISDHVDQELIVPGDYTFSPEQWETSAQKLLNLPNPPSAFIASDDLVATEIIHYFQRQNLHIPKELTVVGIDDQPFSRYIGLTTLKLPIIEAGKQAIQMIIQHIEDPNKDPQHLILSCPLIVRETSGKPRKNYDPQPINDL